MRCPSCGNVNLPEATFCIYCGHDLRVRTRTYLSRAALITIVVTALIVVSTVILIATHLPMGAQVDTATAVIEDSQPNASEEATNAQAAATLTYDADGILTIVLPPELMVEPIAIETGDGTVLTTLSTADFADDGAGRLVAHVQLGLDPATASATVAHVHASDYVGSDIALSSADAPVDVEPVSETTVEVPPTSQPADQILLIAANRGTWEFDHTTAETCRYMVCDLDHDSLLELIAMRSGGSGRFTDSYIWEVSATEDALETRFSPADLDYAFAPDWSDTELVTYYADGRYIYLHHDFIRNGWMDAGDILYAMTAEASAATWDFETLGSISYHRDNQGDEYTVTHLDAAGNTLAEADYDSLPDRTFAGLTKGTTTCADVSQDEVSADTVQALTRSWEAFRLI